MKMKKILVIILAIIGSAFTTADLDWKNVTVIEKVKVSMPTEPFFVDTGGGPQQIRKSLMADSTELGLIVLDFTKIGISEEQIEALKDTEEFKEQVKQGISQSGVQIKSESEGQYNNKHLYYQFELEISKNGKKMNNITRMVFYKQYAFTLTYQSGNTGDKNEIKDQYFNSLIITE